MHGVLIIERNKTNWIFILIFTINNFSSRIKPSGKYTDNYTKWDNILIYYKEILSVL